MKNKLNVLKEISQDVLEDEGILSYMKDNSNPSLYQFVNVMGDKWRIAVPIIDEKRKEIDKQMLDYFNEINNNLGFKINLETFIGEKPGVFIDKEGREFQKLQKVGVGKLMQKLSNEAAKFWQLNNAFYTDPKNIGYFLNKDEFADFYLIISRHPIDILRMSDFYSAGIESCHSRLGSYFSCAVEESKSGSIIAYAINKKSFLLVKDKLQDNEIFFDEERNVDTEKNETKIEPLLRIRARFAALKVIRQQMREFVKILVPEERVYGVFATLRDDMQSTFSKFLYEKQKEELEKLIDKPEDEHNKIKFIKLFYTGGSYKDSRIIDLLRKFIFNKNPDLLNKFFSINDETFVEPKYFDKGLKQKTFGNIIKEIEKEYNNINTNNIEISPGNESSFDFDFDFDEYGDSIIFNLKIKILNFDMSEFNLTSDEIEAFNKIMKDKIGESFLILDIDVNNNFISKINFEFEENYYSGPVLNEKNIANSIKDRLSIAFKNLPINIILIGKKLESIKPLFEDIYTETFNSLIYAKFITSEKLKKSGSGLPTRAELNTFFINYIFEKVIKFGQDNVNEARNDFFNSRAQEIEMQMFNIMDAFYKDNNVCNKIIEIIKNKSSGKISKNISDNIAIQVLSFNAKEREQNNKPVIMFYRYYHDELFFNIEFIKKSSKEELEKYVQIFFNIRRFDNEHEQFINNKTIEQFIPDFFEVIGNSPQIQKKFFELLRTDDSQKFSPITNFEILFDAIITNIIYNISND